MNNAPAIGSLWFDTEGCDIPHKFIGVMDDGRYHLKRIDYLTGEEGGDLWIGKKRFKEDMVSADAASKQPCCGRLTIYPSVWCDDCSYEAWSAARDAKEKTTQFSGA